MDDGGICMLIEAVEICVKDSITMKIAELLFLMVASRCC